MCIELIPAFIGGLLIASAIWFIARHGWPRKSATLVRREGISLPNCDSTHKAYVRIVRKGLPDVTISARGFNSLQLDGETGVFSCLLFRNGLATVESADFPKILYDTTDPVALVYPNAQKYELTVTPIKA